MSVYSRQHAGRSGAFCCRLLGATLLASVYAATPASAGTATQKGAQKLEDTLARYFGRTLFDKGMISISPQGESYDLSFELDSAKLGVASDSSQIQFGPYSVLITPKDDGTYGIASTTPSLVLSNKTRMGDQPFEVVERMDGCSQQAVFDPRLMFFSSQTASCDSFTMTVRSPVEDIDASSGKVTAQSTGTPGRDGGVDIVGDADIVDFSETVTIKNPAQPMVPVVVRADHVHQEATAKGVATAGILDIAAFLVGKGSYDKILAAQDDVKAKVAAAFPIWRELTGTISSQNLSIGLPVGIIRVAIADQTATCTGLVKDGRYAVGIKLSGLSMPDGLVPGWAGPLVPKDVDINLKLSGIDIEAMAHRVIKSFDAGRNPPLPDSLRMTLLGMLGGDRARLDFDQSLTGTDYDVKGQGGTTLVPNQLGKAQISASGLDEVINALNPARGQSMQRALLGLSFLKGLARNGPDGRSLWDVEFDSALKKVVVNGQAFGPGAKQ